MFYYIALILTIIKISIYLIFDTPLIAKIVLIILLLIILLITKNVPKIPNLPGDIIEYYKIQNNADKLFCFFMLFSYIILFIGGILYLRFSNIEKTLDLKNLYTKVYQIFINNSFFVNALNILVIVLTLYVMVSILRKSVILFKRYFVKIHLYYHNWLIHFDDKNLRKRNYEIYKKTWKYNWYGILSKYLLNVSYVKIVSLLVEFIESDFIQKKMGNKFSNIFNIRIFDYAMRNHIIVIIKKMHYILLLYFLINDIIYNNFVLSNVYKILPYIFIYDLYIRISNICDTSWNAFYLDNALSYFMYSKDTEIISHTELRLGPQFIETKWFAEIILRYLKYNLNMEIFSMVDEETRIEYLSNTMYYDYFKDWKKNRELKKLEKKQ